MQRLINKRSKGFTLIELIVVMAIIGILVLLAAPRYLNYTNEAKLTQIKNDVKATQGVVTAYMATHKQDLPEDGTPADIDLLYINAMEEKLYNETGKITNINDVEGSYFEILDKDMVIKETKTKLDGDFVVNLDGKVYYIHDKVIPTIPRTGTDSDTDNGTGPGTGTNPDDDTFVVLKPIEEPADIYEDLEDKGIIPASGKIINAYNDASDPTGEWVHLYEFDDATSYVTKYVGYYNTKTTELHKNYLTLHVPSHVRKIVDYAYVETNRAVLGVAADAFNGEYDDNMKLQSIYLPNTIKVIEDRGIANNNLVKIQLPTSLEAIGDSAFASNRLGSLQNSINLKTIGANAFRYNNIGSLVINNLAKRVESIGDHAFADNQWLGVGTISFLNIGGNRYVDNSKEHTEIDLNGNIVDGDNVKLDTVKGVVMGEGVFLNSTKTKDVGGDGLVDWNSPIRVKTRYGILFENGDLALMKFNSPEIYGLIKNVMNLGEYNDYTPELVFVKIGTNEWELYDYDYENESLEVSEYDIFDVISSTNKIDDIDIVFGWGRYGSSVNTTEIESLETTHDIAINYVRYYLGMEGSPGVYEGVTKNGEVFRISDGVLTINKISINM